MKRRERVALWLLLTIGMCGCAAPRPHGHPSPNRLTPTGRPFIPIPQAPR